MCCFATTLMLLGPRAAILIWWIWQPGRWDLAFSTWFWPILGFVFAPWTTMSYVLVAPGGVNSLDWIWIGFGHPRRSRLLDRRGLGQPRPRQRLDLDRVTGEEEDSMAETNRLGPGLAILTGLVAIALGILLLAMPKASLTTVIWLFGLMVIAYGVLRALAGLMGRMESRSAGVAGGLLAVIAGVLIIAWPGLTALTLLYIIAGWAVVMGVVDIFGGFVGEKSGGARLWSVITGVVSVAFGIALFVWPATGALAILWLIGIYLIVSGVLTMIVGVFAPASQVAGRHGTTGTHPV